MALRPHTPGELREARTELPLHPGRFYEALSTIVMSPVMWLSTWMDEDDETRQHDIKQITCSVDVDGLVDQDRWRSARLTALVSATPITTRAAVSGADYVGS